MIAFPFHRMESTKWTRQASAVQIMYIHVPTCNLHDSMCHHRGMTERVNPIPENTVNTVFEAVISAH